MASSITKVPMLRYTAARAYSAQAAPIAGVAHYDVQTRVLPNKLIVATAENDSPISRVSILFRAGSRNEAAETLGTTHVLRIVAGTTTQCYSQFAIARQVAQCGASLSCTMDRETIAYTLEGTRAAVRQALPILSSVATQQIFYPWEVAANDNRLRLELATRPPQLRAIDLLHKAAYRAGLGNSLYIAKYNIGKISSETLQHYVACKFTSNRAAVVGVGVEHGSLIDCAQNLPLEIGNDDTGSGVYKGGEIRSDKGGHTAYVAIAGPGAGIKDAKEALAFAVLQRAYGMGPSTKRGLESSSILRKTIGDLNGPHSMGAINVSYSDSGLFGVLVTGAANIAGNLVEGAARTLKSARITDEDINRGINQLRVDMLSCMGNGADALERISLQTILTGTAQSPCAVEEAIDAISASDVQAAAKKVASSRLSIAAVGNLQCVPFLDELK